MTLRLSDLLAERRLTNKLTRPILMDADVAIRCDRARREVEDAQKRLEKAEQVEAGRMQQPAVEKARAALDQAEAEQDAADTEAEAHLVDFVFESVGSTAWDELIEKHPSPKEQVERLGEADPGYDLKSWPIAVVAACLKQPEIGGQDDVRALKDAAPDIVWDQILAAAVRVNRGANAVPKSRNGSTTTPISGPRSEQP